MEEKILIKGDFGGKFIPLVLSVLGVIAFIVLTIIDISGYFDGVLIAIGLISAVILFIYAIIINEIFKKRELIITNKRVIARGAFGFRADLPIEKITDVSMRWINGIGCASPSLRIRFHFCKNKTEVFDTIISESLQRDSKYQ